MSSSNFLGPVAAFVLILALIPAALWLLKRTPLGGAAGGLQGAAAPVRLVGALALSPSQRLVTVEVGQGEERRWLVLGVSPAGIHALHDLPPQATAPAPPPGAGTARSAFAQLLQRQQPGASRPDGGGDAR